MNFSLYVYIKINININIYLYSIQVKKEPRRTNSGHGRGLTTLMVDSLWDDEGVLADTHPIKKYYLNFIRFKKIELCNYMHYVKNMQKYFKMKRGKLLYSAENNPNRGYITWQPINLFSRKKTWKCEEILVTYDRYYIWDLIIWGPTKRRTRGLRFTSWGRVVKVRYKL